MKNCIQCIHSPMCIMKKAFNKVIISDHSWMFDKGKQDKVKMAAFHKAFADLCDYYDLREIDKKEEEVKL